MRLARSLRISVRALAAHRLRAALCVAGTAIGIGGVVVLTAVGAGARGEVVGQMDALGRDLLVVLPARVRPRAGRVRTGEGIVQTLETGDAAAIVHGTPRIARAAPAHDRGMRVEFRGRTSATTVLGTTPDWLRIRRFPIAQGRFFTAQEDAARARVAVLGAVARANLFPDTVGPIGRTIRIGAVPFQVVGVLAERGVSVAGAASEDDQILVPLETALHRLFAEDHLTRIDLQAAGGSLDAAAADAAAILRARHDPRAGDRDDFVIQDQRRLLAAELAARTSFQRLLAGLGFLSLLVAAAGILASMLLSVRERRGEIGLRTALGARRRDILAQFLAEALLLALAGGALGILLGVAAARAVAAATAWPAGISAPTLALASASALLVGIASGTLPALRAAAVDPVTALRAE